MFSIGYSITQAQDKLENISPDDVYRRLCSTQGPLFDTIRQLRLVNGIDVNAYRRHKTGLPYIVAGHFNPAFRKSENFAYTKYCIIDIDHLVNIQRTAEGVKQQLSEDNNVFMAFVSPGGDGVKVIFRLAEKCHDAAKYKLFYQEFSVKLAATHQLGGAIDSRTSDVTRACFLSHDPNPVYNPVSDFIDIEPFIAGSFFSKNTRNEAFDQISITPEKEQLPIDDTVLDEIKRKLNPAVKQREKIIFVPEQLDQLMPLISDRMAEYGLVVSDIQNIHYGKKIKISLGIKWAEVNVFYGRRGYTVVKTPKSGSNSDLCDVAHTIISEIIG